jgi:isohexenylglutaconyl-CoA hydratase
VSLKLPACNMVRWRRDGWCLHLMFDRPEVRNALNEQMWDEIDAIFTTIESDRSIRAVVLRGSGGTFCAGGDLKERAQIPRGDVGQTDPMLERNRKGGRILMRIDRAPQVVIAVVQGAAMGGGFGMVCVCDVVLAGVDARFRMPEVTLGIPPAQISPFITRRIGTSQARRLALTAATLDASEALTIGLVHAVCADEATLDRELAQTLRRLDSCAPEAISSAKQLIALTGTVPLEKHIDLAGERFVAAVRSAEGREGAAAFQDRRPPAWSGAR